MLSGIQPAHLRRHVATTNLLDKVCDRCEKGTARIPLYEYITETPELSKLSRRPVWRKSTNEVLTASEAVEIWRSDWNEARTNLTNGNLIDDPTIPVAGGSLPRGQWSSLNRVRTGVGRCQATRAKWGISESAVCPECRQSDQTMFHLLEECDATKIAGGPRTIHEVGDEALQWLKTTGKKL